MIGSSTLQRARQTADAIFTAQSTEPEYKKPPRVESFEALFMLRFKEWADVKMKQFGFKDAQKDMKREIGRSELQEFSEMNFGELEGKTEAEVKSLVMETKGAWRAGDVNHTWPGAGGENLIDVEIRACVVCRKWVCCHHRKRGI